MILEFDAGNTRIKWRCLNPLTATVEAEGVVSGVKELIIAVGADHRVEFARLCSVRAGPDVEEIRQWIATTWGLELQIAEVSRRCGGVSNHYIEPGRLGVDRWLAMLAARQISTESCVIVDSGTALTIDVLDRDGEHRGGFIIPGLSLMRESLQANTDIRVAAGHEELTLEPGHSTEAAVFNGTLTALIATIERVSDSITEGGQPTLYFTGGGADLLAAYTSLPKIKVVAGLVLDGLTVACPYSAEGFNPASG